MDLFQCPACGRRYLTGRGLVEAADCPACEAGLELVVRSIPGTPEAIAAALGAEPLDDSDTAAPGLRDG